MLHNSCGWVLAMILVTSGLEDSSLDQHRVPTIGIRSSDISIRIISNGYEEE
jgi:hypothetical protein